MVNNATAESVPRGDCFTKAYEKPVVSVAGSNIGRIVALYAS